MISQAGFAGSGTTQPSSGVVGGGHQHWTYSSSDSAVTIAAAGYFTGVGYRSRGLAGLGMKLGDLVLNIESSAGAIPGRATWHSVTASSANVASTSASSGFSAAYNVTVSAHAST
jgi:hypothetical protein